MSEYNKYDVKNMEFSVGTVEEFDKLLEVYKRKNPEKYAKKMANGEFEKFRSKLAGYVPPVKLEEPKEQEEQKVEEKFICLTCGKEYTNKKRFDTHCESHLASE